MKTQTIASILAGIASASTIGVAVAATESPDACLVRQPTVQLALLLDTSNSMDGLIDQARTRLWSVVNELATARHDGIAPRLEVALFEYGNSLLSPQDSYIRRVSAFTDDLDLISEQLFALRTNGGSEYCGAVIARAIADLGWSRHADDLKLVFIAGNEPFDQGPVDFRAAVRDAAARGVTINTIFCGPEEEGVRTSWKDGAVLADGTFAVIDHNQRLPHIAAPQDREIAELNTALNATYLAYGAQGGIRAERQARQDSLAQAAEPSAAIARTVSKSTALYNNSAWDLVDAVRSGTVEVDQLAEDELPAELRGLDAAERAAKIAATADERQRIQARIQQLAAEREAFVTAELTRRAAAGARTAALDDAILQSVRAQAENLDYRFDE